MTLFKDTTSTQSLTILVAFSTLAAFVLTLVA